MSKQEHPTLRDIRTAASAFGEIGAITRDSITIVGDFAPGLAVTLRPGVRVVVLTDDDVLQVIPNRDSDL